MSELTISFVVPAYNEEALIASCLYAILAETSRLGCRAEIIVVDNNSTDRTRQIAAAVPGVVVVDEPQRGLVQARRAGCQAAHGQLIANIDADTMIPPGWLDTVLAAFVKNPDLAALSGPFIHYDVSKSVQATAAIFYRFAFLGYLMVRFVFRAGSMMQGGNFVIRKSALDAVDAFNPDFSFYGEDTELARRLSKVGAVKFSFGLPAFSSGRRLTAEGLFHVAFHYSMNYLWTLMFKQPFTLDWLDFRHPTETADHASLATATAAPVDPPQP
ncbi:MAG TPA: glycosyltransferase family 2 protein [Stellaceae bacterium]|nr:glycosyltransferase family 2 protein [Stellaceae bacterium]